MQAQARNPRPSARRTVEFTGELAGSYVRTAAAAAGKIALIPRGNCQFGLKVAHAGAAAALIYNSVDEPFSGATLGGSSRPEGPYVPVVGVSQVAGLALEAAVVSGAVVGHVVSEHGVEVRASSNVVATTRGGDRDSVVFFGAHTDSVEEGRGSPENSRASRSTSTRT